MRIQKALAKLPEENKEIVTLAVSRMAYKDIGGHTIRSVSCETRSTLISSLYANPKNCVKPDQANDGRRTTSSFQKQLKLILYSQTCVPYVNADKTYPPSKKLV